jgi:hypothetical protein
MGWSDIEGGEQIGQPDGCVQAQEEDRSLVKYSLVNISVLSQSFQVWDDGLQVHGHNHDIKFEEVE